VNNKLVKKAQWETYLAGVDEDAVLVNAVGLEALALGVVPQLEDVVERR